MTTWMWIVLAVVVIALAWWLMKGKKKGPSEPAQPMGPSQPVPPMSGM